VPCQRHRPRGAPATVATLRARKTTCAAPRGSPTVLQKPPRDEAHVFLGCSRLPRRAAPSTATRSQPASRRSSTCARPMSRRPRWLLLTPRDSQLGVLRALLFWRSKWGSSWSRGGTPRRAPNGLRLEWRTTRGLSRVDVIYPPNRRHVPRPHRLSRRLDARRAQEIMDVRACGVRVTLANAPGTGVAGRQGRSTAYVPRHHSVLPGMDRETKNPRRDLGARDRRSPLNYNGAWSRISQRFLLQGPLCSKTSARGQIAKKRRFLRFPFQNC